MRVKRFSSNEEVIAAVKGYFAYLPGNHYRDVINKLEDQWNISKLKAYIEKYYIDNYKSYFSFPFCELIEQLHINDFLTVLKSKQLKKNYNFK